MDVAVPKDQTVGDAGACGSRAIARHGLVDDVYEAIFNQLMALEIAPGARITVDTLVREFGVSQTPIREALGRLEGEGLVVKTHLIGYSAAPQITRRGFEELYELRLALEPDAASRAAEAMDEDGFVRLDRLAAQMSDGTGGSGRMRYSAFARQDAAFHDAILDIAGNALIRDTLAHQHTHFHIFRLMFHSRVTEEALDEHAALMRAFAERDGAAAGRAMRMHVERSRDRLRQAFG